MADVAVIGRPANEDTRQALVLTEDRVGHYPEFRAFFVRTFDLDRVGLSEPGYVQAPSGLAYALVFIGRSGEPFPAGLEVYAIVPALEPLDDVVVDRDLWAILGWMIDGVGAPWTWKDCTPQAGSIASPQPRDLISASLELTDRLTAPAGAQALIETNTC